MCKKSSKFAAVMQKKTILYIIEWTVSVAALAYLAYRLATYDAYASLWACLRGMGVWQWLAIIACVALMPVNMALEAWRWHSLMNGEPTPNPSLRGGEQNPSMSWSDAQRQVYYSKLAGLITPWRLGEYPARALLVEAEKPNPSNVLRTSTGPSIEQSSSPIKGRENNVWQKVLSMGAVGSATMTAVIIVCGAVAMIMDGRREIADWRFSYLVIIASVLFLLGLTLYLAPRLLKRWAVVTHKLVAISLGQSFMRLLCWCVQLGLVLFAFGALNPQPSFSQPSTLNLLNIPIYYLLVTITPNVPVAEVGVRGAWAIFLFGTANAALAGVMLWAINTLLPCLAWFFLRKKQ